MLSYKSHAQFVGVITCTNRINLQLATDICHGLLLKNQTIRALGSQFSHTFYLLYARLFLLYQWESMDGEWNHFLQIQ